MTRYVSMGVRIYGRMVMLYPEDLRREYGAEMTLVFEEDLRASRMAGAIQLWLRAFGELLRIALPAGAATPAVRVPAITLGLFLVMASAPLQLALPNAMRVVLTMPLLSTPWISLAVLWACRSRSLVSLHLSGPA